MSSVGRFGLGAQGKIQSGYGVLEKRKKTILSCHLAFFQLKTWVDLSLFQAAG